MRRKNKLVALTLLLLHTISVFYPGTAYALTDGPTQPESSVFQAASVSNLVDPFSGDFSYNIPLLDVDGYPVNLAYSSGGSMDDESSWVGYGWNVNPGSVSRIMKGIPDDFNGTDQITKEYNVRPDVTGGVSFNASLEVFGLDFLGANASVDIFYNNQRGLGVEIGAGISATLNTAKHVAGEKTTGLAAGASLGITSNSQTGADFNFGANLGISSTNNEYNTGSAGLRFNGSLNSRAGMKSTTLSPTFNTSKRESKESEKTRREVATAAKKDFVPISAGGPSFSPGSATTSYGQAFNPTINMPFKNESYSLSPQLGVELWGLQIPIQITGHYTSQKLAASGKKFPAYGFLHSNKGRTDPAALLDFNREKDVPYMESTPTLAVPYVTQDIFTANSHLGSSQFKAFSNSSGIFFDSYGTNTSDALALGIEFGAGGGIKGGADLSYNGSNTVTRKWIVNNDFLPNGDFSKATGLDGEDAYFKLVGEKSSINKSFLDKIAGKDPVKVRTDDVNDAPKAFGTLVSNTTTYPVNSKIARNIREPRGEMFMPLLAEQAQHFGLDKKINNYALAGSGAVTCNNGVFGNATGIPRVGGTHKPHHISEVNVSKHDGTKLVYGVPVYNNEQTDVTFSVGAAAGDANNMVGYTNKENSKGNESGVDYYFSKETVPAYATSYLLSGICSPDYVDLTGNGISDDDLGTAVKFNYTMVNDKFNWRTPNMRNNTNYANFNKGKESQSDDNKASISYGNKELWYGHSIESKNMIAIFRLGDRNDGYGYNPNGSLDMSSKQKKLDRIDLYTKAELISNPTDPVPIKSVHFEYDYSLFNHVPNNINDEGKLTLKSVYFTYGKSTAGKENRYYFTYNASGDFQYQQYDRWGVYKDKALNNSIAGVNLDNNDFPYAVQDSVQAKNAVKKWQLSQIELPSGGKIKVEYESDDYAFVQNKRAMQMAKIIGYGQLNNYNNYQETDKVFIQLPAASTNKKVGWEYFEGVEQLYFKSMINLDDHGSNELVSGFAKIKSVKLVNSSGLPIDNSSSSSIVEVTLDKRGAYHPIAAAAWQSLRSELPKLAYSYSVNDKLSPLAFIKALISAIRNVSELVTPFEQRAMNRGFASKAIAGKCFARIGNKFQKYGGGLRVKKITMDDIWADMAGTGNGRSTSMGMLYDYTRSYTTADGTSINISSGVASYEPMAGSEENPFKLPITYQQKAHLTSSIFTVEEPLGESYFPSASVGYSQVTVKNLDAEGNVVNNGYVVNKFYTAKDFPTIVKRTDLSKNKYNQTSIFGLFNIDQGNSVVLSQGFYVENNDMHGKQLSDETFDGSGKLLAGSYYHYKSSGTEQMTLDNNALILQPDGTVKNDVIAQEFEMFHDMREQVTDNIGVNLNFNLDVLYFAFIVIPFPTLIPIVQSTYSGYESAATIKVVNKYAIPDKVTTIENGSTMVSENMLWDGLTGQVLLTKTQNGFDDPLYNFTLPSYMVNEYEKGMGGAYKNTGILFSSANIINGQVPGNLLPYIVPGDELGIAGTGNKLWAMDVNPGGAADMRLIKMDGSLYTGQADLLLLRSGRRNMIGSSSYSVVSLKNPIRNGKIEIDAGTEILSTSAGTFSDEWTSAAKYVSCTNTGGRSAAGITTGNATPYVSATGFKPVSIADLAKKKKARGALQNGPCDPCDLNSYLIEDFPNSSNMTCVKVSYDCIDAYPLTKLVTFVFSHTFNGVESIETVTLGPNHTEEIVCFSGMGPGSSGITLVEWSCRDNLPCEGIDPCTNLSAYTIEHEGIFDGTCVTVRYNCAAPFPDNVKVYFVFTSYCNGLPVTAVAIIDKYHLVGRACGIEGRNCGGGSAVLQKWYCEEGPPVCTDPCTDINAYDITIDNTSPVPLVVARYKCDPSTFPAGKTANLVFWRYCNGIERRTVSITRNNPMGIVAFANTGTCASYTSIQLEGLTCEGEITGGCCPDPVDKRVNPYYTGLKGNWRSKDVYAYTTDRLPRPDPSNTAKSPTNLRKGGIFQYFTSFYKADVNGKFVANYAADNRWIATSTLTKVNHKGQEVENRDALNRYSAAQFGFNDLVATAVASNARNGEIAYDGFEDYGFNTSCGTGSYGNGCNEDGHFNFKKALTLANGTGFVLSNAYAHTGNYSVKVAASGFSVSPNTSTFRTTVNNFDPLPAYTFNSSKEMILKAGGVLPGFSPQVGKKYIVSGWIKGDVVSATDPDDPSKAKIKIEAYAGSASTGYYVNAVKAGPKVEGWTRVMAIFELPAGTGIDNLAVKLVAGYSDTYFDDIRIHPFDGNMKTYAFDYKTSRLMAELDENNYATFYEYNDEGQLLRNKKETEKGIVTLKETRSRVRKNQQ